MLLAGAAVQQQQQRQKQAHEQRQRTDAGRGNEEQQNWLSSDQTREEETESSRIGSPAAAGETHMSAALTTALRSAIVPQQLARLDATREITPLPLTSHSRRHAAGACSVRGGQGANGWATRSCGMCAQRRGLSSYARPVPGFGR